MLVPEQDPVIRRRALFHETAGEKLERWALGTAWVLKPGRVEGLPALGRMWAADLMSWRRDLPDPDKALTRPAGLAGIVHDFTPDTIMEAYRRSLFPFAHFGPLKWFSPAERCVLHFDELHIAKRLRRLMRQDRYRVTFDTDFEGVIKACAGRRQGKWHVTWITPRIMHAFSALHDRGEAHSFEVWNEANQLVGGGYGLAVGKVFSTESQFSLEPNTSKLGFTVLNWHLAKWGFAINDGKWPTPTIDDMGFRQISRGEFRRYLEGSAIAPRPWRVEEQPAEVAGWQPGASHREAAE
jgi:leucyl/phenylalanyl-tRNA--protein transferase